MHEASVCGLLTIRDDLGEFLHGLLLGSMFINADISCAVDLPIMTCVIFSMTVSIPSVKLKLLSSPDEPMR